MIREPPLEVSIDSIRVIGMKRDSTGDRRSIFLEITKRTVLTKGIVAIIDEEL
jgi:hypothetical protein